MDEGRIEEAKRHLLAAGRSSGSPVLGSFGPNMSLAKDLLEKHGFPVTWRPFDGGHEIPPPVLAEVDRFLFSG